MPEHEAMTHLAAVAEEECWQLLDTTTVGRLAFTTDTGIEVLPLNFVVFESRIYFRTEPGSPIPVGGWSLWAMWTSIARGISCMRIMR